MKETLQILNWKEAYPLVRIVNPALAELIHQISPSSDYPLIKATYAFGDLIVQEGKLQLPYHREKLSSIASSHTLQKIQSDLSYSTIPLSLLLNKNSEVFLQEAERTIPLNIIQPGQLFGTFEALDFMFNKPSSTLWNVSAGARSIFMLPKINESFAIKRLRNHYHLSLDTQLKYLTQHWQTFKEISHAPTFSPPWQSEVLFFTKPWFTQTADPAWSHFYHFLFGQGWEQAEYAITELNLGPFWRKCIQTIAHRRLKPNPYLIDTVKQLLTIATGLAPGLTPANSEINLPLTELEKAFTEIYLLNPYTPTIMCPTLLTPSNPIVYYSLSFPTLLYSSSYYKTNASFMSDLKMVKLIIDSLVRSHSHDPLFQKTHFRYFHTEKDIYNDVEASHLIPDVDEAFLLHQKKFPQKDFCASSSFWRGCLSIASKKPSLLDL